MSFRSVFSNVKTNVKAMFTYPANLTEAKINPEQGIMKAFVSNAFLYKPPYGYPRMLDIPTVRALAKSPYVFMVTSTIIDEVASIDWDVVPKAKDEPDEEVESEEEIIDKELKPKGPDPVTLAHIKKVKDFFYNPNGNEESFEFLLRSALRDILEIDSGVFVKVFNLRGKMVQLYARDGGCLNYNSMIETDIGNIPIGKIVKDKLKCNVKTYNFKKNQIEWKPITNYRCSGTSDVWYKIKTKTNSKYRSLTGVTHNIPTPEGKKLIENLNVGDVVYTQQNKLNKIQNQIILGSLLGDGFLRKGGTDYAKYYFRETHSIKQKDYLLWKFENLKEFNPVYREYMSAYSEKYKPTLKCEFKTRADIVFENFINLKYPIWNKKIFDKLEELGLAVWLQDDGYMYPYGSIDIATHSMPKNIQEYGLEVLKNKWGIEGKLRLDKRCDKWFMNFNKENSKIIINLIKDFIHPNFEYKFKIKGNPPINSKTELNIIETEIYSKEKFYNVDSKYDIEVEGNHNYFAQGVLVNNTFLKNPDIHGYLGNKAEFVFYDNQIREQSENKQKLFYDTVYKAEAAYFQYGWVAMMPIPFGRREIVYMMRNPRSDSIYGRSPVELLHDIIMTLIYGSTFHLEYFTNNNMPDGIIELIGANKEVMDAFRERLEKQFKKKDSWGNWRKIFHKYPISNVPTKFTPFTLKPAEMEIITQQQWFTKLVWACYDEETEILTEDGFKLFKDLNEEKVARVNPDDLEIDFVKPIDKQKYDFDGEMISYKTKSCDILVTPEHKMLQCNDCDFYKGKYKWEIKEAKDFNRGIIPQAGNFKGVNIEKVNFKDLEISGDNFCSFMGIWLSDGWVESSNSRVCLCASDVYPENKLFIEELLREMDVNYKIRTCKPNAVIQGKKVNINGNMNCYRFSNKEFHDYLIQFGKAKDKFVPKIILNSDKKQRKLFLDSFILGDGSVGYKGRNDRYGSMSKNLLNGLQELLIKNGISATLIQNKNNACWELTVRKNKTDKIENKYYTSIRNHNVSKQKYKGKVYDITVPEYHHLIIRRNGRVSISGNCFGVTPSELGFTENSNRATEMVQSKVFRRKAIRPLLKLLEYHINTQIMPEFGFDDIEFQFNDYDLDEDLERHKLFEIQLKNGIRTKNEVREDLGLDAMEGGDELKKDGGGFPFGNDNQFDEDEEKNLRENAKNKLNEKAELKHDIPIITGYRTLSKTEEKALPAKPPLIMTSGEKPDKKLKSELLLYLRTREKAVIEELKKIYTSDKLAEVKDFGNLWERLIEQLEGVFQPAEMKAISDNFIKNFYIKGLDLTEGEFAQNFTPNQKAIDFLQEYNFDLVQNMSDELANKLKATLQRAYMNDAKFMNIKEEVKSLFDKNEVRANAIVRTEMNRAESFGRLEGASQSKLVKGKSIVNYDPESDICKRMIKKYGDRVIPLNEKFVDDVTGDEWICSPFHPNCKTRLITPRIKEKE